MTPSCFFQPAHGGHVSAAVKILTQPQFRDLPACKFAVRSGGHTGWAGAGSIEGGVTIDLSNMKEVVVSPDKKMVTLGPGSRWGEVYPKLEEQGVAVSGGRWGKKMIIGCTYETNIVLRKCWRWRTTNWRYCKICSATCGGITDISFRWSFLLPGS